jgi:outer membrane protein W
VSLCCALVASSGPARAENLAKKWRVGLALGAYSPQDAVPSDAANVLTIVNDALIPVAVYTDPRRDSLLFATLEMQSAAAASLSGTYAITKRFAIEGSIGYSKPDVGEAELQVMFDSDVSSTEFGANYRTFRIPVGQATVVPLQLAGIVRFRPERRFNPYVGLGVGYQFVSLETSGALDELSGNLVASTGVQAQILPATPGVPPAIFVPTDIPPQALEGATVDAPDAFIWHLQVGAEYSWSPDWAVTFDIRHVWAQEELTVGFNGGEDLGISVPHSRVPEDSPLDGGVYGPMQVRTGGLIDGGSVVPGPMHPADTDCTQMPTLCLFDSTQPDGIADTGLYYINGGAFDYRAFSFTVGVRYTF